MCVKDYWNEKEFYFLSPLKNKSWKQATSLFSCILCVSLLMLLCNILLQKATQSNNPVISSYFHRSEVCVSSTAVSTQQGQNQGLTSWLLSGGPGEESASKLVYVVGKICFSWLQDWGPISLLVIGEGKLLVP